MTSLQVVPESRYDLQEQRIAELDAQLKKQWEAWNNQRLINIDLEAQLTALRESNRVALAEAYRCGYEAAKLELETCTEEMGENLKLLGLEYLALRDMVVRMYLHCTEDKAEMTQAEIDEWYTAAALLGGAG